MGDRDASWGKRDGKRISPLSRLWVPLLPALGGGAAIALIWADREAGSEQRRNLQTFVAVAIPLLLLFFWMVFLAPLSRRVRRTFAIGSLAAVILAAGLYRIEGVDGDLVPIIRPRWWGHATQTVKPVVVKENEPAFLHGISRNGGGHVLPMGHGAADFPQFLGPDRNGILGTPRLDRDWSIKPPVLRWKREIGSAWSAFSVAGGRAITQEQRGNNELVVCYDLATGKPLWSHSDPARYDTTIAGIGPRATPTIAGDRVITLGATGILNCLDLISGDLHWSVDVIADNDATMLEWGMAGSPLVDGDRVIVNAGGRRGSVTAYDLATGNRLWSAGDEAANYASPVIFTLLGQRQLIIQNNMTITGHDPADGKVLWSHPTPGAHPKVAQALRISDNRLLISSGYGTGSQCFELEAQADGAIATRTIWKNIHLKSKFANMVRRDGHVYGLNDGTLTCLRVDDGSRAWRGQRVGHGQLLLVDDLLLITAESGDVILVEATPNEFRELSRFRALDDKTWNSPALAGRLLLVRNDREAACFELPVAE